MGRRHLTDTEAAAALRRGNQVEQFLAREEVDGDVQIAWVTASVPRSGEYRLRVHRVHDIGSSDVADLFEFPPVDETEQVGEGRVVAEGDTPELVLHAAGDHGALADHWVNEGVVADEYLDAR